MMNKTHKTNRPDKPDKNRMMLLNKISKAGFMLGDIHLYLDTHPTDMHALKAYAHYQKIYEVLKTEYENRYGPLTPKLSEGSSRWDWIDGPWPWENEINV